MDLSSRPAFPRSDVNVPTYEPSRDGDPGMTLLEYFAGQSLAGYRANPETFEANADAVARWAVADAKALCAALAKPAK